MKINKKHILIFVFAISLILMRLGYALLTEEIKFDNGNENTNTIYSDKSLTISNIEIDTQTEESSVINDANYHHTISTFHIYLNNKNDSITYLITIKNNTDNYFRYNGVETLTTQNPNIIYEISEININDIINPQDEKIFKLTFKYTNEATNILNPYLEASIKINFTRNKRA